MQWQSSLQIRCIPPYLESSPVFDVRENVIIENLAVLMVQPSQQEHVFSLVLYGIYLPAN